MGSEMCIRDSNGMEIVRVGRGVERISDSEGEEAVLRLTGGAYGGVRLENMISQLKSSELFVD